MLSASPVVRSSKARVLFILCAVITAGLLYWATYFFPDRGVALTPIFARLFLDLDTDAAGVMVAITVLAVFVSQGFAGNWLLKWIGAHVSAIAVGVAVLLSLGTLLVYHNHPLAMDEYAPYFQSQIFAAGRLTGSFPVPLLDWLVPPPFQNYFLTVSKSTGAVFSGYWPSFALLLTPFTALGISWACNPAISALTIVLAHRLALKMYGSQDAAALVVLLVVASPEFLVNGITYYSMPAHLLANTLFALLLIEPTRPKAFVAGVVGSVALTLHNPMPHLLFALPWILWVAGRPDGNRLILSLAAGYVPLCLLLGVGWFWFTMHLRQADLPAVGDGGLIGRSLNTVSVFTFPDASVWLARSVGVAKVWLWSVPGLLLLAAAGARRWWRHPAARLLAYSALATLVGFIFVPVDQGHGWGYRYFHTAWIALPLLAAGAFTRPEGEEQRGIADADASRAFVVACAVLMLLIGVPHRAAQVQRFVADDLAHLPQYTGGEKRVVFIDASRIWYGYDLVQNEPFLKGDVINMVSHGAEMDAHTMAAFFPSMHRVFDDRHGTVWSEAPVPAKRTAGPRIGSPPVNPR